MRKRTFIDITIVATGLLCILNYDKFLAINSKMNSQNNKLKRYNEFIELNETAEENSIIFAGDSITHWYPTAELFKEETIYNRGSAGYFTSELLEVFDETIISIKPSKIFLLIGTNDMSVKNISPEMALKNTSEMIDKVKTHLPDTKIYLISVYPVNVTKNKVVLKKIQKMRNYYGGKILKLNSLYKQLCIESDVVYIDLFDKMCDDTGQLKLEYTVDGLHLSIAGYRIITEHLEKYML